jgi:adenylate cyclase class IV
VATLDWKGAASFEAGYKHRDETSVTIGDAVQMAGILSALGYVVTRAIDRDVRVLRLGDATLRVERFPRMDTLLEVEGPEAAIEAAIRASGLPRESFTPDRLYTFVQRYEARTGHRAAICDAEAAGVYRFSLEDA